MVKNVLASDINLFIDSLKRDLIKCNISHLIVYCAGYYELHLDGVIFRIFQSNLENANTSYTIYSYIAREILKNMNEYENNIINQSNVNYDDNKNNNTRLKLSKKKTLKMTNDRYKINDHNSIKLMRSKKLC